MHHFDYIDTFIVRKLCRFKMDWKHFIEITRLIESILQIYLNLNFSNIVFNHLTDKFDQLKIFDQNFDSKIRREDRKYSLR